MAFTRKDIALFDILEQATNDEKLLLSKIISDKISSDIDAYCTDAYKITRELQLMGGHSAANIWRGHGVPYHELALDAAEKAGAKVYASAAIEEIEWALLEALVEKAVDKMNEEDREKFYQEIRDKGGNEAFNFKDILKQGSIVGPSVYVAIARVSMPYILRTLGMNTAAGFMVGRAATSVIPVIGWGVALGSIFHSMAGTAYTVTIPCTAYVGAIRARLKSEKARDNMMGGFDL